MKGEIGAFRGPFAREGGALCALAALALLPWALASIPGAPAVLAADAPEESAAPAEEATATGPERIDTGQFWLLDFQCVAVRPAIVDAGGGPSGDVFWYMVYTVENRDAVDHSYRLTFRATSDKGRSYACMVLPEVERRAEERQGRELLGPADLWEAEKARRDGDATKFEAATTLKAGEKRWCVATFNRIDAEADKIEILVRGLTNEFRVAVLDDGRRRVTEKAMKLFIERPGDEFGHGLDTFKYLRREWTTYSVEIPASGS
ncbi:MAG: hypothetical protein JXP34_01130 [Planctomycetes bacterium]|nr:hypothetical protein [Planctomycetota bacterium]